VNTIFYFSLHSNVIHLITFQLRATVARPANAREQTLTLSRAKTPDAA
jgi:hypothetical protein